MIEKVVTFGSKLNLVGILTEPGAGVCRENRPSVILLNAGVLHRVGPFRMSVLIARGLAAVGFTVLRFDLSGLGDSEARHDQLSDEERARHDITSAMDLLSESKGVKEVVLMGLCSGAYNAHAVALRDDRVVGTVFLDGYGYRTKGYHLRRALYALMPARWLAFVSRKMKQLGNSKPEPDRIDQYVVEFPSREIVAQELQTLADRAVRMLFVYSGGVPEYFNSGRQFFEMYSDVDFKGTATVKYFEKADHTYSMKEDRDLLLTQVVTWMINHFNESRVVSHDQSSEKSMEDLPERLQWSI